MLQSPVEARHFGPSERRQMKRLPAARKALVGLDARRRTGTVARTRCRPNCLVNAQDSGNRSRASDQADARKNGAAGAATGRPLRS
jgi:hypothetical protein